MTSDDDSGKPADGKAPGKPGLRSRGFKGRPGQPPAGRRPRDAQRSSGGSRGYKDRPPPSTVTVRERSEWPEREPAPVETGERIAKRLARAGVASRREAEAMIAAGRITLNGAKLDSPAINVTAEDKIAIDGNPIPDKERTRLWLFHKPAGLVTSTRDDEGRPTVFERLPSDLPRVITVGRLDINTEGLLLLTNDGGLARTLELPQTGWLRRYRVRAHGRVNQKRLDSLKDGIAVDGVFYGAIDARLEREQGSNMWIEIGLREGKNREVKNVLGALGLEVNRLIRISFGPFQLGGLEPGETLEVKGKTLRDQLGARLIAESGADFEAPIRNVFPNRPVKATPDDTQPMTAEKSGDWVSGTRRPGQSASPGPKRHEKSGDRRERLRDQWSTQKGEREDEAKPKPKGRPNRGSNVWMAPGARPEGKNPRRKGQSAKPAGKQNRPDRPSAKPQGRPPRKPGNR